MALSKHVDADDIFAASKDHPHLSLLSSAGGSRQRTSHHKGAFGGRYATEDIPRFSLAKKGISEDAAYQLITGELALDGRPTLNLASFVHTWVPEPATRLVMDNIAVNLADQDEYEATTMIHGRCVSIIADLWHAPKEKDENGKRKNAVGTATTGSSEAIMLGVLAMKRRWQHQRQAAGKDWSKPNLVFGSEVHCSVEKATRYFEVEERIVGISADYHYRTDPKELVKQCDENTIGVVVIMGTTYTGVYEPVKEVSDLLDDLQKRTGLDIGIHVDAASGGFVAPFTNPDLPWDFRLPRVHSINASGHKYGLALVGVGWIIFRSESFLPKELVFELHYLGSVEYSFSLNFSRPAAPILCQYYNFVQLGFEGYKNIMEDDLKNARILSRALEKSGYFEVLSEIHHPLDGIKGEFDESDCKNYQPGLPVVTFKWTNDFLKKHPHLQQKWLQTLLRVKGYIVPCYELSAPYDKVSILRVVVRETSSVDALVLLFHEIMNITESLMDQDSSMGALAQVSGKAAEKHDHDHPRSHSKKKAYSLEKGSGTKSKGWARQC